MIFAKFLFFASLLSSSYGATALPVALYGDDDCDNSYRVLSISPTTRCENLRDSSSIKGVRIQGVCLDLKDTNAVQACHLTKSANSRNAVHFYNDDGCDEDDYIASIDQRTRCSALGGQRRVYAYRDGNNCFDIRDTDAINACEVYKNILQSSAQKIEN